MRVLITGGAGFIGSHIVDALRAARHDVVVLDDFSTGSPANVLDDVELIRHDLADHGTAEVVRDVRPGVIVHAAAQVSVAASTVDPVRDATSNVIGSVRLFEGARAAGVGRVVYITTGGALYGEPRYVPCDEEHPIDPISPYGLSKWVAERYLAMLMPDSVRTVLRLANVYGPRQSTLGEAGVVATFASRMLAGDPVEIHGDGGQTRDFVYVGDVAAAVSRCLGRPRDAVLNIGSGSSTSVLQLFETMQRLTHYGRRPDAAPARTGDVRHSVLDVRRAAAVLGWRPEVGLDEGLRRTIDWYQVVGRAGTG